MTISVVHTTVIAGTSGTIPATTAGNCLVVAVCSHTTTGGAAATVSGITLGGSADHFGDVKDEHELSGSESCDTFIWADPNCAGGQTAVAVSGANLNITAVNGALVVYEVSGLASTLAGLLDQFSVGLSALATSWSSGATPATTVASELWVGAVAGHTSVSTPGAPWTEASVGTTDCGVGQQVVSSTGTATYSGTQGGGPYAAVVVTLKSAAVAAVPGTVQPRATVPVPRRGPARGLVAFRPVATVNAPPAASPAGTVQPRATVPVPRRGAARAVVAFRPVAGFSPAAARTLLLSIAATAGTDDFGNAYPQGIAAFEKLAGVTYALQLGSQAVGAGSSPAFFIQNQASPAHIPAAYTATAVGAAGTGCEIYSGQSTALSSAAFIAVEDSTESGVANGLIILGAGQVQVTGPVAGGLTVDALTVTGANALSTPDLNMNPLMATPPNAAAVAAGTATLPQLCAFANGLYQSMKNRGMFA